MDFFGLRSGQIAAVKGLESLDFVTIIHWYVFVHVRATSLDLESVIESDLCELEILDARLRSLEQMAHAVLCYAVLAQGFAVRG